MVAPNIAAAVSGEAEGGCPDTGPVFLPATEVGFQSWIIKYNYDQDLLGLCDAAFKAIVARPRVLISILVGARRKSAFRSILNTLTERIHYEIFVQAKRRMRRSGSRLFVIECGAVISESKVSIVELEN